MKPTSSSAFVYPPHLAPATTPCGGFWLFAYGSLIWSPDFPFARRLRARLDGYHRRFVIYSRRYRGDEERPGLVLGLREGGACQGVAFHIAGEHASETLARLQEREQFLGVYHEKTAPIRLLDDDAESEAVALCFVADRRHPAFAADLTLERQARIIRLACGLRGSNKDYLAATQKRLHALGIPDPYLDELWRLVADGDET